MGEQGLRSNAGELVSLKLTLMYSWVHGLVFMVLGLIAAYLLLLPARKLNFGIALLPLFAVQELGFVGTAFVVAKPVLDELATLTGQQRRWLQQGGAIRLGWCPWDSRLQLIALTARTPSASRRTALGR